LRTPPSVGQTPPGLESGKRPPRRGGVPSPVVWSGSLRDYDSDKTGLRLAEPLKPAGAAAATPRRSPRSKATARSSGPATSGSIVSRSNSAVLKLHAGHEPVGLLCRCHAQELAANGASPGATSAANRSEAETSTGRKWRSDGRVTTPTHRQRSADPLGILPLYMTFGDAHGFPASNQVA